MPPVSAKATSGYRELSLVIWIEDLWPSDGGTIQLLAGGVPGVFALSIHHVNFVQDRREVAAISLDIVRQPPCAEPGRTWLKSHGLSSLHQGFPYCEEH